MFSTAIDLLPFLLVDSFTSFTHYKDISSSRGHSFFTLHCIHFPPSFLFHFPHLFITKISLQVETPHPIFFASFLSIHSPHYFITKTPPVEAGVNTLHAFYFLHRVSSHSFTLCIYRCKWENFKLLCSGHHSLYLSCTESRGSPGIWSRRKDWEAVVLLGKAQEKDFCSLLFFDCVPFCCCWCFLWWGTYGFLLEACQGRAWIRSAWNGHLKLEVVWKLWWNENCVKNQKGMRGTDYELFCIGCICNDNTLQS